MDQEPLVANVVNMRAIDFDIPYGKSPITHSDSRTDSKIAMRT